MKRQGAIFVMASVIIAALGLWFVPPVVAGLPGLMAVSGIASGEALTLRPASVCSPAEMQRAQQVTSARLAGLSLDGPVEVVAGPEGQQLQVTLPPGASTPQVISVITQEGDARFIDAGSQMPRLGAIIEPGDYPTLFTGEDVADMTPPRRDSGELFYTITLHPNSARQLENFNAQQGHYVCLVVDDEVASCSKMYHLLANTLEILPHLSSPDFSLDDLTVLLTSGSLPTRFELVD
ncbi:MAG: hypothetical protein Kow0031_04330 [Anaerolineae bacterium]